VEVVSLLLHQNADFAFFWGCLADLKISKHEMVRKRVFWVWLATFQQINIGECGGTWESVGLASRSPQFDTQLGHHFELSELAGLKGSSEYTVMTLLLDFPCKVSG
jgi:hypothetical protein